MTDRRERELMLGIFLTGVFIYSVVAYWVMNFN